MPCFAEAGEPQRSAARPPLSRVRLCLPSPSAIKYKSRRAPHQNQIPSDHGFSTSLGLIHRRIPLLAGDFSNPGPPTTITAALGPRRRRGTFGLLPRHPNPQMDLWGAPRAQALANVARSSLVAPERRLAVVEGMGAGDRTPPAIIVWPSHRAEAIYLRDSAFWYFFRQPRHRPARNGE